MGSERLIHPDSFIQKRKRLIEDSRTLRELELFRSLPEINYEPPRIPDHQEITPILITYSTMSLSAMAPQLKVIKRELEEFESLRD